MSDRMQDKLGAHADWKDGHDAFRKIHVMNLSS